MERPSYNEGRVSSTPSKNSAPNSGRYIVIFMNMYGNLQSFILFESTFSDACLSHLSKPLCGEVDPTS